MIPNQGVNLIIKHERFEMRPYWPGGYSGVTWGYGWDSGYHSLDELYDDWLDEGRLTCPSLQSREAILNCVGKTGVTAQLHLPRVADCFCLELDARIVFEQRSLPKYEAATNRAFPGASSLPDPAYGALCSLVFNRGESMGRENHYTWDSRREMREIREAVAQGDLRSIAESIRSMKRLWLGKNLGGLITRREEEAVMVEEAIST